MFMSVVSEVPGKAVYGELAGCRVLVTGLTAASGVDLVRAFAEHKAQLIVQSPDSSPEMTEIAALLAGTAADVKFYSEPLNSHDDAVRFAQTAARAYGGLDVVINIATLRAGEIEGSDSYQEIEDIVADKLAAPTLITRVVANRMRLTWTEGSILNILIVPASDAAHTRAVAGLARTALAAMTRGEAQTWADQAIRINAIGPRAMDGTSSGACLTSEPDIAALALYLASRKGRQLSGHVFDAEGVAGTPC